MGRAKRITDFIKAHDHKLFAKCSEGKLCIYRKSDSVEWYDLDGINIGFVRPTPHLIMALTHNWHILGQPVEWGLDVILARLQAIDLWNRDLASEQEAQYEERKQKTAREASNKTEDFLREFKRPFAESFKDINVANLKKIDKRRNTEKKICQS